MQPKNMTFFAQDKTEVVKPNETFEEDKEGLL